MSLEELRKKREKLTSATKITIDNMEKITDESYRVVSVARDSKEILENLEREFESQTGLDQTDMKFLFFATALQMGRWILIAKLNHEITAKLHNSRLNDNDSSIKKTEREARDKYKSKNDGSWDHNKSEKYRSWLEIVDDGVPYDVSVGSPNFGVNMEAGYHRIHTIGHDPVLGWIFGPMNILSDTITLDDYRTYKISPKPKHWEYQTTVFDGFKMAMESINEDDKRLPAAIFAQALHLKSDLFTKNGLPIPVLETFDPALAGKLYKNNYDSLCLMQDVAVVGTQALIAILINTIISLIHGLYYDPRQYESRDVYEVKTRKILLYSNRISSASNLLWVGGNAYMGNDKAIKDLDIGGLMETMHRLVTDTNFIRQVKQEFVFGGFNKMIQGEELNLEEV